MRESYLVTRDHWPEEEAPEDLLSYFVSEQLWDYPDEKILIYDRKRFLELLDKDAYFEEFWIYIHEIYPEKSEYFASLRDEQMPYDCKWIEQEYYKYLYEDEFNELSETKRKQLQDEFDRIRPEAYEAALKGEAIRLNCNVSEVRPICLVLPLPPDGNEQSKLLDLPDAIFLNIMNRLDTWEVFKVTLTCKKWRSLVQNNSIDFRRAEHAKTTHLITFTEWMDPTKTPSCEMFEYVYRQFSLGLLRWCCEITNNLETVILDHPISYIDAAALVQSCPNLKNLQIGCDKTFSCMNGDGPFSSDVVLPKLEFFSSRMYDLNEELELDMKILISCKSLLYYGAQLIVYQIPTIEIQNSMKLAFRNLVALDLAEYTFVVLELLADVDNLNLRYLGLSDVVPFDISTNMVAETTRLRILLERILPKLKDLEILKVNGLPGIGSSIIKLLTNLKLNLKFVVFAASVACKRSSTSNDPNEGDCWNAEVLTDFGQMLLSNDPGLDLSDFYFIVLEEEIPQDLREMDLGFTFISAEDCYDTDGCDVGLNFQSIKRLLGIDF